MTRFFIKWWVDYSRLPDTPLDAAKRRLPLLEAVKAVLSSGTFCEWGQLGNGMNGYAISDASEAEIYAAMLRWTPVVQYKVFPLLNVDQSMEAVKKAIAAMQA